MEAAVYVTCIFCYFRGLGAIILSNSEVARIREQYELEYQAARRGLEGIAIVAPHCFVTKRMEQMWDHFQRLVIEVGQTEAHRIIFGELVTKQEDFSRTIWEDGT
jgi:hypothetical protein